MHEDSFSLDELRTKAFHLRTKSGLRPVSWAMLENYHDKNEAEVYELEYCYLILHIYVIYV